MTVTGDSTYPATNGKFSSSNPEPEIPVAFASVLDDNKPAATAPGYVAGDTAYEPTAYQPTVTPPPPTSTNGISFKVWLLPSPSSLSQTIWVLSSMVPPAPPGSGVSASRLVR